MILYHGTSGANVGAILENGIQPRGDRPSNWELESHPGMVYLTRVYAPYYACVAAGDGEAAIVEVEVDEVSLFPDEDFLEQSTRNQNIGPDSDTEERVRWFRERLERFEQYWQDSLDHLGTVAHEGEILPRNIRRISVFNPQQYPWFHLMMLDPVICIQNYWLCCQQHKTITSVCLGEDFDILDLFPHDFLGTENRSEMLGYLEDFQGQLRIVEVGV